MEKKMTHTQFINKLDKLYHRKKHCVKFYWQHHTFSFHIYREDDAYHGKTIFDSETYYGHDIDSTVRFQIITDIENKIKDFESNEFANSIEKKLFKK